MDKILTYEKEIVFNTNVYDITSISLEHDLSIKNFKVLGHFTLTGEYKVSPSSATVEAFSYELPFETNLDDIYDTKKATVDIDDFYYEIINNKILKVCIDVKVDKLKEQELVNMERNIDVLEDIMEESDEKMEENVIKNESKQEEIKPTEVINSLFDNINGNDNYVSYNIYILREGDTVESIIERYEITEENLKKYNDLSNLQIGDKIVIPSS